VGRQLPSTNVTVLAPFSADSGSGWFSTGSSVVGDSMTASGVSVPGLTSAAKLLLEEDWWTESDLGLFGLGERDFFLFLEGS